jgi:hypothetical protein
LQAGVRSWEIIAAVSLIPRLTDARDAARASILRAHSGINPVAERRQQEAHLKAEMVANSMTFARLADADLERHAEVNNKEGTLRETRRHLARASEFFGDKPLRDLTEADVAALIETRTAKALRSSKSGRAEASNLLAVVGRCLKWGKRTINPETRQKYIAADISADIVPPMKKGSSSRDRVLSDDEIRAFWNGCVDLG